MSEPQQPNQSKGSRSEPSHIPKAQKRSHEPGTFRSWLKRRLYPGRFDFDSRGKQSALIWCFGLVVLLTTYVVVKLLPHCPDKFPAMKSLAEAPGISNFVQLSGVGVATITSPEDIDWYVGTIKFTPVRTRLDARNKQIEQVRLSVISDLTTLANQLDQLDGRQDRLTQTDTLGDVWRSVTHGWPDPDKSCTDATPAIHVLEMACSNYLNQSESFSKQKQAQEEAVAQFTKASQDYAMTVGQLRPLLERLSMTSLSDPSEPTVSSASRSAQQMLVGMSPALEAAGRALKEKQEALNEAKVKEDAVEEELKSTLSTTTRRLESTLFRACTNLAASDRESLRHGLEGFRQGVAEAQLARANQLVLLQEKQSTLEKTLGKLSTDVKHLTETSKEWSRLTPPSELDSAVSESVTNLSALVKRAVGQASALGAAAPKPVTNFPPPTPCEEVARQLREALAGMRAQSSVIASPPVAFEMFVARCGGDLQGIARQSVSQIRRNLAIWEGLRMEQEADIASLRAPEKVLFFWSSPIGLIVEVLVWSLLGVLTNLALATSEAVRKKQYKPVERFVGYTKLAYGPVLALVLSLMVVYGMIDVGSYQVRSWALPLVAFLFGFASRRTARVIDRAASRVLGDAEKSANEGMGAVQERYAKRMQDLALPTSIDSFETTLNLMAPQIIGAIVTRKQKSV